MTERDRGNGNMPIGEMLKGMVSRDLEHSEPGRVLRGPIKSVLIEEQVSADGKPYECVRIRLGWVAFRKRSGHWERFRDPEDPDMGYPIPGFNLHDTRRSFKHDGIIHADTPTGTILILEEGDNLPKTSVRGFETSI